ncbi:MAG TPA: MbnP family protein [Cyclobacteriaceae bacterium]|nr:MbnP family protein [Cyclobacteriaceae bacterium]
MKSTSFIYILICIVFLSISSCTKDDKVSETAPITLHFDNVVSSANLQMNTNNTPYMNSKGEAYKVTWLTYYVSAIKLKREDGTIFTDPVKSDGSAGYYLVDENDAASQDVTLQNVPAGDYTEVTFTIGVDASQVNQGAQTGALDPAKGLFWSWNSGYIFLALEGVSPVSTEKDNVFQFHVGGYKTDAASMQVNNIRTVTLSFNGDKAPVRAQHEPEVHLLFDVNKFLNGSGEQVTFTANTSRHMPMACQKLADNINGAFVVDHIHAN